MALPLYLALRNRLKAMLWSGLLGGLSQPLGAAIAAIWFKVAGKDKQPGELGYGIMFAITGEFNPSLVEEE
jgi:ZIP family zinc transporter